MAKNNSSKCLKVQTFSTNSKRYKFNEAYGNKICNRCMAASINNSMIEIVTAVAMII